MQTESPNGPIVNSTTASRTPVVVALGVGVFTIVAAGAYAKASVAREPFLSATVSAVRDLASQPVGTLLLLAPVALFGFAVARSAPGDLLRAWWFIMAFCLLPVVGLYMNGFGGAEQALRQGKWTAATLSVGLLPFAASLAVLGSLVVVAVARALVLRLRARGGPAGQ
jgi:hypothetical protein